ncbi:MAG: ATP-dependent Clp protease, protease subunit [Parcubacteria group bacterium Gr01-1014_44]|nr:MAG: ATP-dependent Clp protease, protease subunit [Parcubacteria group bacterium Gr01-1014_44]
MTSLNPNLKPPAMQELEEFLGRYIKGQPQAIKVLAQAYASFQSGVKKLNDEDKKRPIGVFLFLGPSRTGKTEAGRILAKKFHGTKKAVTLIDCVSYQERHEIAKLIGAPPGYIGYGEKPILSKEKLYAKIPGYQTKPSIESSESNKMEKREGELVEKVDLFSTDLDKLALIEQALKNIDRHFSNLKNSKISGMELFEKKENLKEQRVILQTLRNLLTVSFTETALQLLKNSEIANPTPPTKPASKKAEIRRSAEVNPKEEPILIIIFDEIEKAHETVRQFLLHLMEEGQAVLGNGDEVDLSHSYIILTSNIGSKLISKATKGVAGIGFASNKISLEKLVKKELKKLFSQEFLNRLDGIVTFNILSPQNFKDILEIQIEELTLFLAKVPLALEISQPVKDFILEETAKKPEEQVKSLQDCFKKYLVDPIGNLLTTGQLTGHKKITVVLEKNEIVFKP